MGEEEVYKVTLMEDKKDAAEEEEAAGDIADPFEMMGGMGEEEVYKVTLMEDKAAAEDVEEKAEEVDQAVAKEEEEEATEVADPFEMMGGMGEEEVYKVTL